MTQAPTPGPLDSESVKLLVKGASVLLHDAQLVTFSHVAHDQADYLYVESLDGETYPGGTPDEFVYVGERDADGWMPWSGGENPVGDAAVEVKYRNGETEEQAASRFGWTHWEDPDRPALGVYDIIAFRLAPTAPVEASGSEREAIVEAIKVAMKDAWEDHASDTGCWPADIKRVSDRGPLRLMFTPAIWAQTTAEWAAETILRNCPQPSGETQEAMALVIEAAIARHDPRRDIEGTLDDANDILALLSACPLSVASAADAGRQAIWKVVHAAWQLLDEGETGADGAVTIDQARYQEVSAAMDELEALVPDSEGPTWGGFPVNYFWGLK